MAISEHEEPVTYMIELHTDMRCDSEDCDFEDRHYLNAVEKAEAHHRETGHNLIGTRGYEVWVGSDAWRQQKKEEQELLDTATQRRKAAAQERRARTPRYR